tara:strand:+ start:103155 stop:103778 length:624 start_codon:yes stop_codon:yes gene_type:complete
MSSDLLDIIGSHLNEETLQSLSRSIDATPEQTQTAISAALPTLIGAMARNASEPAGQEQLYRALSSDHDGSILDSLGSLFSPKESATQTPGVTERTTAGGAILDHILGSRKPRVEQTVGKASGLSSGQVMKLLMMLAPLLMGALGKRRQQEDLSPGGLSDLLRGESERVESASGGGMIGRMLDQDGDGDFDMMDMLKFGAGKLFGGR